jgi:hypothetical protein
VPQLAESSKAAQENNKAAQEMTRAHDAAVQEAKDKRKADNAAVAAGNAAGTQAAPAAPAAAAASAAATDDADAMPGFDDAPTDIITATDEAEVASVIASARAADNVAINSDSRGSISKSELKREATIRAT